MITKSEFDQMVERYRVLSARKKKIVEECDEVKTVLDEYISKNGVPGGKDGTSLVVFGKDYKVSKIPMKSVSYNTEGLKSVLGDSLKEFQNVTEYSRIDVR